MSFSRKKHIFAPSINHGMKKLLIAFVALSMMACGNKTKGEQPVADSTAVEIPDTLYTVEAVINQVNAVYEYWNQQRLHYDEKAPTVDERFGSKEWNRVRDAVAAIDRECECGGFFDFGDEGPLDAWVYDCYEGTVSANDIQVQLQSDSTANVHFLVKDAVTLKGVPIRWTMQVEDGQWRVQNIFFESDDNFDILENMRGYVENNNNPEPAPEESSNLSDYAE